jgi:hypothetical protein
LKEQPSDGHTIEESHELTSPTHRRSSDHECC